MLTAEEIAVYAARNAALQKLGFSSYKTYLHSAIWKDIRWRILTPSARCRACGRPANTVHHNRYHLDDLNGKCLDHLIPTCRSCHKQAEFTKIGTKLGPERATQKLDNLRLKNQRIWQRQDAAAAWKRFFAVVDEIRIYLGMEDAFEARRLVEELDIAQHALPPKKEKKRTRK